MLKSLFSRNYENFVRQLRAAREGMRVTQEQLGERLGLSQSEVSKVERGERRLDVVELWAWCRALQVPFTDFTAKLAETLGDVKRPGKDPRRPA